MNAPLSLMAWRTPSTLWLARLSRMTTSPGLRVGGQELLDIGFEGGPIHRAIKDERSDQSGGAQTGKQGAGIPVAPRRRCVQPLALEAPPAKARHVGLQAGFIEKDQPVGLQPALPTPPSLALLGNVGATLLARPQRFMEWPAPLPRRIMLSGQQERRNWKHADRGFGN